MGENVDATGRKSGGGQAWKPSAGGIRSLEGGRTKPWVYRCHHRTVGSRRWWIVAGFVILSFSHKTSHTPQNSAVPRILNPSIERTSRPCFTAIVTGVDPNVRWGCYSPGDRHVVSEAGWTLGNAACSRLTSCHPLADTAAGTETETGIGTDTDMGRNSKSEVRTII